jgi:hypothetical protein
MEGGGAMQIAASDIEPATVSLSTSTNVLVIEVQDASNL